MMQEQPPVHVHPQMHIPMGYGLFPVALSGITSPTAATSPTLNQPRVVSPTQGVQVKSGYGGMPGHITSPTNAGLMAQQQGGYTSNQPQGGFARPGQPGQRARQPAKTAGPGSAPAMATSPRHRGCTMPHQGATLPATGRHVLPDTASPPPEGELPDHILAMVATDKPSCPHNKWVLQVRKKRFYLMECMVCQKMWKTKLNSTSKCLDFFSGHCPLDDKCPHPHIYSRRRLADAAKDQGSLEAFRKKFSPGSPVPLETLSPRALSPADSDMMVPTPPAAMLAKEQPRAETEMSVTTSTDVRHLRDLIEVARGSPTEFLDKEDEKSPAEAVVHHPVPKHSQGDWPMLCELVKQCEETHRKVLERLYEMELPRLVLV
eukprot:Sspe_Gene.41988::Locus_20354_Transcript_1_1_Confidence_1.000_Length_1334::g.41988::m.41988